MEAKLFEGKNLVGENSTTQIWLKNNYGSLQSWLNDCDAVGEDKQDKIIAITPSILNLSSTIIEYHFTYFEDENRNIFKIQGD